MAGRINYLGQPIDEPLGTIASPSAAYNQIKSRPVTGINPALHGQGSDPMSMFMQMMQAYMAQQQGGAAPNHVADITALRNDPQGDMNKLYQPGVDNAANPFSNGVLPSHDALVARAAGGGISNPPPMSPPSHMMPSAMPNLASRMGSQPFMPWPVVTGPGGNPATDAAQLQINKRMTKGRGY